MSYPVMPLGFLGSQGDQDTYKIERSLRFNSADSAYLSRTPASAGNRKTWTWSGWVKRGSLSTGNNQEILSIYTGSNTDSGLFDLNFNTSNQLSFGGYSTAWFITSQVFRDVSSWYHIVIAVDSSQSTSSSRLKLYINGSEVTSFSTLNYPALNQDFAINTTNSHQIGRYAFTSSYYFDGYLTEINFIDGQALTPSSFGETDALTGRWKAKAYSGTYGTNGFYLKFADNSGTTSTTLGKDSSGNGNNWTPNNFSVTAGADNDSLLDSPTNNGTSGNYCTINPFLFRDVSSGGYVSGSSYISDGNLKLANGSTSYYYHGGSIGVKSGKWYFEAVVNGVEPTYGNFPEVGFVHIKDGGYRSSSFDQMSITMKSDTFYGNLGTTYVANDIVRIAIDIDSGKIWFGKNNSWLNSGDPSAGSNGITTPSITGYVFPSIAIYGTSSITANFGQRPFAYTAPTGFRSLCTTNLPTPTIRKPSSYMDVVTYTGNGTSPRTISGFGLSPDLLWIKNRTDAYNHIVYDTVRGAGSDKGLSTNTTKAENNTDNTNYGYVSAFTSDGFSTVTGSIDFGLSNTNSKNYVAWAWDEAPIAGMDIVSYTGNGTTQNISHSLGVAPKMIIVKSRSASSTNWTVGHTSLDASSPWGYYLYLDSTSARMSAGAVNSWGNNTSVVAPTSSVFTIGNGGNLNSNLATYIAYLFAEVEGFSKFGSYTGNGSADGSFVWCGFRPRWVMIKRSDASSTYSNWYICDSARNTFNVGTNFLNADTAKAENIFTDNSGGSFPIDFLSNGFKYRLNNSGGDVNASGGTYIFAAFAESAFKYSRAR